MRYVLISQLYWPIWLLFKSAGHTWLGILGGAVVVALLLAACWRLEWGNWWFK